MWKKLGEHIRQYWVIYLTLSSVYLAGVVFGAVGVGEQRHDARVPIGRGAKALLENFQVGGNRRGAGGFQDEAAHDEREHHA